MKMRTLICASMAFIGLLFISIAPVQAEDVNAKGKFEVKTDDGDFSFKFGGQLQVDIALYDEDVTQLNNGTEFRRARLFASGKMFKNWEYKAQYDFAGNEVTLKDAYIRYAGLENGKIIIGQFKQPFSLENLTSSKYITFMERASPNALATGRRIGAGYNRGLGANGTLAFSVYGQEADAGDAGDEGFGASARVTFAPVKSDDRLLHVGFAVAQEKPEDGLNDTFRFRSRPESHVTDTRLVDTGALANSEKLTKYGVEFAWVRGRFSLQSEYIAADVSRKTGFQDVDFDSFYIYGSFFINGDSRAKAYKDGSFGRVKPNSGSAWEIALRYSTIDLNDINSVVSPAPGAPILAGVFGGKQNTVTLGVNYYANNNIRFMMNYIAVDAEQTDPLTGLKFDDSPNVLQFRAQIDF